MRREPVEPTEYEQEYWYLAPTEILHSSITSQLATLLTRQSETYRKHLHRVRMYSNRSAEGLFGGSFIQDTTNRLVLKKNITKGAVDTLVNHYGTQSIKLNAVTNEGSWRDKQKAKLLNKFWEGQFANNKIRKKRRSIARSGFIFSKGFLHVYEAGGEIKAEPAIPYEMVYDEREARYGNPRMMFRVREVSRQALLEDELYKGKESIIEEASVWSHEHYHISQYRNAERDRVTLIEAWRLPSEDYTPGDDDEPSRGVAGRYVATLDKGVLIDDAWEDQDFPFAVYTYQDDDTTGIWGTSVVDEIEPLQMWLNELLNKAYRQLDASSLKILVDAIDHGITTQHLSNEDATILFTGMSQRPPVPIILGALDPNIMGMVQWIDQNALGEIGLNQLSAQGVKPAGLDSGAAQREYNDLGAKRLLEIGQGLQEWDIDVGSRHVELARRISEDGEHQVEVYARTKRGRRKISWSEINLTEDQYTIEVFPANFLSETPAGKREDIAWLANLGVVDPKQILSMLDMPDIKGFLNRENMPFELVELHIELLMRDDLEPRDVPEPDTFVDPSIAGPMVSKARIEAFIDGAPEKILEQFDDYLSDLADRMERERLAQQQQMQPQQPQGPPAARGVLPPPGKIQAPPVPPQQGPLG